MREHSKFEGTYPHKDAWTNGLVDVPGNFASLSLFERSFSQLFFCESLLVETDAQNQLSQPFTSLPAVRQCTSLEILQLSSPLTVAEVLEWLHVEADSGEPKLLKMDEDGLGDRVENLVHEMKTVSIGKGEESV